MSLNGSDAKGHAHGMSVTEGPRGLRRGHDNSARKTWLSRRNRVSFHVLNRGNGRQTLFFGSADYEAFVRVVKEALLIVPMRILGYCLMPNHFVLWPELDDQLSAFMHQLMTTHVRRWQKAHHGEGEGHVYQGRFKSFPVESDEHLYTLCRYVERNAVRAGLVERAEDWVRSSVWARLHPDDSRGLPLDDWPLPSYPLIGWTA